jgi:hypothetical protein
MSWYRKKFNPDEQLPFLNMVDTAVKAKISERKDALNIDIHKIYQKELQKWSMYLDTTGLGVLKYLGDLLQVDLSPIKADRFL